MRLSLECDSALELPPASASLLPQRQTQSRHCRRSSLPLSRLVTLLAEELQTLQAVAMLAGYLALHCLLPARMTSPPLALAKI